MLKYRHSSHSQRGVSLLEILVSIIIIAFGLLGLAGLQGKMQLSAFESYQRQQAILLLTEITDRINANRSQAANYASSTIWGTGDGQPATCTGSAGATLDLCQWSNNLKGASEVSASSNVGAMIGARGCITQIQAPDPTAGVCQPGIYQVDVVWQGLQATNAPTITCAQGSYGSDDKLRRVISSQITIGMPSCS